MAERPTLVIGDVHGHVDRLQALLEQEGIIEDGKRVNDDVRVVQVGDLGNFGVDFTADEDCYREVLEGRWIDTLLWGNHDRAVFDNQHIFGGYRAPIGPVKSYMAQLERDGRYKLADHAHGYLLTHAGVARYFDPFLPATVEDAVDVLNNPPMSGARFRMDGAPDAEPHPNWSVVNAIGYTRGGWSRFGGILWRDISEPLSSKFNQVFGHSADPDGLVRHLKKDGDSDTDTGFRIARGLTDMDAWCIDIGGKYENRLAGIWLPEMRIAKIDLDA